MIINTNVSSITAQEAATNTGKNISSSLEKLSTGLKINKASDDASGLAIADKLRTQATSIDQGVANGNSAVTLLQIADKSMSEQSNILDTIKSKLIQANTDTTSEDGRESIRKDISKLLEQLDNIAEQTNYNGNVLLQASATDTSSSQELSFQIGESNSDIISNTAIQSNTSGLGSEVIYSAANQNNTISAAASVELASTGTISLTATTSADANTAETVSLSGDVDSIALKEGMTISGMDATTQAALVAQLTGGAGTDYDQSGNTFTIKAAGVGTLDLSAIDSVTANVTTPAEGASSFAPSEGDIVTASTTNNGSALATALADNTKFTDNLDGTYTAKAGVAALNLEAGESVDYNTAATSNTFANGAVLTLTANAVAGSEFANALGDAAKFTLNSGVAGQSGAVYTASGTAGTINIAATEAFTVDTPTNLTAAVGDIIDTTGGTVVGGSALETALADATQFENLGGNQYKALQNGLSIALESTESVSKFTAVTVGIGSAAVTAGSTIDASNVVAGSDLSNQLNNAAKFTDNGGGNYTVLADFTADNLKLVGTESITITPAEAVTLEASGASDSAMIDDANVTLAGNAADWDDVNGNIVGQGSADGSDALVASTPVDLVFTVTAQSDGDTFDFKAGDTVSNINEVTTVGNDFTAAFLEGSNWIDNGDNTYTAIADQAGVIFDDANDSLTVTRSVGSSTPPTTTTGTAAATVDRLASTVTGSSTSENVTPSATVSVDVTTDSTLTATNNGGASDTLTISGTAEVSNGGTQLSAIAAVGNGNLTSDLASEFQAVVDDAITDLNSYRGDIGSTQNQVESAVRNLMTQSTNVKAAESIIRDVDYAQESANFNKQNIISQAGSYAISQANSVQQNVLRLLQ